MMKFLPAFTIFLLSINSFCCTAQTQTKLSADEFEKQINAGDSIQVLDVRTAGEFFSGHIKNALHADWNDRAEFDRRVVFVSKSKPVYVYCLAGGRSAAAAEQLRKLGYTRVYELAGGTNAWRAADKPLEGSNSEPQMRIEELNMYINSAKIVLVDFGAGWCPPCRQMEPVLKDLVENNKGKFSLVKVDGGRDQDIVKQYKVTALPVFIIFKDGKQVWRKDGIVSEQELAAQLK